LFIRVSELVPGWLSYDIIDITGKTKLAGRVEAVENEILMTELSSSIYLLRIFSKEEIIYKKVIIKN
jgi:hypothetical protein